MNESRLDFKKISEALTGATKMVLADEQAPMKAKKQLVEAQMRYQEALSFKLTNC